MERASFGIIDALDYDLYDYIEDILKNTEYDSDDYIVLRMIELYELNVLGLDD
jgi:hypothetical protein